MALAHRGYTIDGDTRLRILLGVFDATQEGRPPSPAEVRHRTGLPMDLVSYHLPALAESGLLVRQLGRRRLVITRDGFRALVSARLIAAVAQMPVYGLTTRGLELLERAPNQASSSAQPLQPCQKEP